MASTSDLFTQSARTSRYFRMSQTFGAAISFGRLLESKTPEHKAGNNGQRDADSYCKEKDARTLIGSRPKSGDDNKQEANSSASSQGPNPVRMVAVHTRLLGENKAGIRPNRILPARPPSVGDSDDGLVSVHPGIGGAVLDRPSSRGVGRRGWLLEEVGGLGGGSRRQACRPI